MGPRREGRRPARIPMNSRSDSPLVSIITPARNAAAYLEETIASVTAQTYENWEWLIADDGSTDRTVEIVEAAAGRDPRIRLLRVEGEGGLAARARNTALAQARGELIAFLDADDLWYPEKLETQVHYLEQHLEADGVCCWFEVFGDEERMRRENRLVRRSPVCRREEIRTGIPFQTSTVVLRRRVYDEMGGMDEDPRLKSGQDSEYFIRVVCRYEIHRLLRTLTRYRLTPLGGSLSGSHATTQNTRGWKIFEVLSEKGVLTPEEMRQWRSHLYYSQGRDNLFLHDAPFRGALWRSILAGRPPLRAVLIFALSFLPAAALRPLLLRMQRGVGAVSGRNVGRG